MSTSIAKVQTSWLDRPVPFSGSFTFEKALHLIFIALAIFTRFFDLGARVMSHDESEHVYFSWLLYHGGGYVHSPITHGPFLFHLNALIFSLFGADDFTARISVAVFGVIMVAFPYLLRRWLGRTGALIASFMLLISPSILFHDRYTRDEAYMLVWALVIVGAMLAYWRDRSAKWLYLLAGSFAFMVATMEAAFIFAAIFGMFLVVATWIELRTSLRGKLFLKALGGLLGAIAIAAAVLIIQVLLLGAIGLGPGDQLLFPAPLSTPLDGISLPLNVQVQYALQLLGAMARFTLVLIIPAILMAFGSYRWLKFSLPQQLRQSASFDLAALIFTLSLFLLSPAALIILNPLWLMLFGVPFVEVAFFANGGFPTNDAGLVLRLAALFGAFAAVAVAIGWWWDRRRWLIGASIFLGITATLFTTIFTNGAGLGTGFVGSLGYWLEQQAVQRGSQPPYYYLVVTSFYEYLPMVLAFSATIVYVRRRWRTRRDPSRSIAELDRRYFIPFIIWWTWASWLAYSIAGEKMPWLMVYLALPMILLSGRFLGEQLEHFDWHSLIFERQWLVGLLLGAVVIASGAALGNLQQALSGSQTDGLIAFAATFSAIMVLGLALWGLWRWQPPSPLVLRLVGWSLGGTLFVLTLRTAWQFNYLNYDSAAEFGVFAHGGPGVKRAMRQIEALADRLGEGQPLKIALDGDSSWPFNWYLRNYANQVALSDSPSRADLDADVIIASAKNWSAVESVVRQTHTQAQYHRIWWPMEDYKTFNRSPHALQTLWNWLTDPRRRAALLDIFLNRDYAHYDLIRGTTHTLDSWPLAEDFRLYLRRTEQSSTTAQLDPYAQGWRTTSAVQTWGSIGTGNGQFSSPHGIALASDGSIYVADGDNHRIQKFDRQGNFVLAFGAPSGVNNPQPPT
ncbi:MAG TPA: flippase activity-associated protein Agl23, partial [Anaerolineae bacterium]|nr:flippase activity-associated protein Agl23 [Anaerolineae bacterium]